MRFARRRLHPQQRQGRHQPGDGVQGRGLAGAVRTDQRHDLTVIHVQADVLDRVDGTVGYT